MTECITRATLPELLGRQLLARDHDLSMDEVVERIAGVNAQHPGAAALAMYNRLLDPSVEEVRARIEDGRWVRANLMRGTVHVVTARQFAAWRAALQPALVRAVRSFQPRLMREVDVSAIVDAGHDVLDTSPDGLSRAELGRLVAKRLRRDDAAALGFAARLLCTVVHQDERGEGGRTRVRLVRANRVVNRPMLNMSDGLDALVRSYVRAFDAHRVADFTAWSGLTRMAGPLRKRGFPDHESNDGSQHGSFSTPASFHPVRAAVLAPYDNILFHTADRRDMFAVAKERLIVNTATPMLGAIVDDGRFAGSWHLRSGGGIAVDRWDGPLTPECQAEVHRLDTWVRAVWPLPR